MYRVELKEGLQRMSLPLWYVPNVPCGVESNDYIAILDRTWEFLMYRVELKEGLKVALAGSLQKFLMYRVELKDSQLAMINAKDKAQVPNVPCGVERNTQSGQGHKTLPPVPNVPCGVESLVKKRRYSFGLARPCS